MDKRAKAGSNWKQIIICVKNYWTNFSFPPTLNKIMMFEDENVTVSIFWEKKKKLEESRHCPCSDNNTITTTTT